MIKSLSNITPILHTVSDGVMLLLRMFRTEEINKFVALSGCTYNDEICFVGIRPKFIVCYPVSDTTETVTKLFKGKISVCCR